MALLVAVILGGLFLLRGDDEAVDAAVVADIQGILDSLPDLEGKTDMEQMRSLLGAPDAFTIFREEDADGAVRRREDWYYFEYYSVYSFLDGVLETNLPLDDPSGLMVLPRHWDPSAFELDATWESLATTVGDPAAFESFEFEEEYDLPGRYYVGNQLILVFDEDGKLYYVEAVPLEPGAEEDYTS
ncbi:hypothetical protein [Candidatus Amarobacter glycogenicus]|uniref:hypothetical protein n=1 Tax=Candidatus Amarobacter glycogenicus TaxID=3140699 RepID=UPI0031369BDD|nr:hypothetical protein [Dehalococcoidia bacterium]